MGSYNVFCRAVKRLPVDQTLSDIFYSGKSKYFWSHKSVAILPPLIFSLVASYHFFLQFYLYFRAAPATFKFEFHQQSKSAAFNLHSDTPDNTRNQSNGALPSAGIIAATSTASQKSPKSPLSIRTRGRRLKFTGILHSPLFFFLPFFLSSLPSHPYSFSKKSDLPLTYNHCAIILQKARIHRLLRIILDLWKETALVRFRTWFSEQVRLNTILPTRTTHQSTTRYSVWAANVHSRGLTSSQYL